MQKRTVKALFLRKQHGQPVVSVNKLLLFADIGISGDANKSILSPRQVLLVSEDVLVEYSLPAGSLRENITVAGFDVNSLESGNEISIGEVKLKISFENERCNVIRKEIKSNRGVFATVVCGGEINIGDALDITSNNTTTLNGKRLDLFLRFIEQIPEGKVVTYGQIIDAIGGIRAHLRIIPIFIKKAIMQDKQYPIHRIVNIRGELISHHISNQIELLEKENVKISDKKIDIGKYLWMPSKSIYNLM